MAGAAQGGRSPDGGAAIRRRQPARGSETGADQASLRGLMVLDTHVPPDQAGGSSRAGPRHSLAPAKVRAPAAVSTGRANGGGVLAAIVRGFGRRCATGAFA